MVAKDFFEVLISYEFFSMTVLKVARKSIGERVKHIIFHSDTGIGGVESNFSFKAAAFNSNYDFPH